MILPNPSREINFLGVDRDKSLFPCLADHKQDWRPYPVITTLDICDDHIYICIRPSFQHAHIISKVDVRN